jgi:hypothetical protein
MTLTANKFNWNSIRKLLAQYNKVGALKMVKYIGQQRLKI